MTDASPAPNDLSAFSLFRDLEGETRALEELRSRMKLQVFQGRDTIIDEKQNDDRMFFLLRGQVVINKMDEKGQIVVIGRTDEKVHPFFGESVLLGKYRKSANVVAHSQCECLVLSALDFQAFMESHPHVVATIYRNLSSVFFDRLAKANRDMLIAGLMLR